MKSFFKLTFTLALSLASALCGFAQGDNPLPVIRTIGQSQTINCTSPDAEIGVEIDDWVSGFLYEWNTGQTDSIISVKPMASQTYILHISNADLGINTLRSFQIEVKNDAILVTESNYTIDKFTCAGQPIFIAAIEGTQNDYDRYKTLHVHIALGNTGFPNTETTKRLIEDGVRTIWTSTKVGVDDVRLIEMDKTGRQGWGGYQNKEARKGNTGVIDYSNIQLPMHLRDRLGQQI